MACYTAEDGVDQFKSKLDILTHAFEELFEIILYKRQTAYVAVAPNFPNCQTGDLDILTASNKLLEAVDYIKREIGKGNVDRGKASRAEKSALDAYDLILPFCEVMSQRIIVFESYEKTIENFQILKNFEVNMQVLNLQINYVTVEDEIDKQNFRIQLTTMSNNYNDKRKNLIDSMSRFSIESRALARHENVRYGYDGFNPNFFLNYERFVQEKFNGISVSDYVQNQDKSWSKVILAVLPAAAQEVQEGLPRPAPHDPPPQGYRETHKYQTKYKTLESLLQEIDSNFLAMGVEEMRTYKQEVLNLRRNLLDLKSEPGVQVEKEDALHNAMETVRKLDSSIEQILEEKRKKEETRKQNIQANIRSLGTVKLADLTGFSDYLGWRKSQKALNSHSDPFKKASLLLSTLKNPKDIDRCQGIYDYQELMNILEQKYAHQDKLVPALINRLRRLPGAHDEDVMLENIGAILNVNNQLKSMSETAVSYFDSTVVEDLILKLTRKTQEDYEDYILLKEAGSSEDVCESVVDKMSLISGEDRIVKASTDVGLDSKKKRINFINFLKLTERKLSNLRLEE